MLQAALNGDRDRTAHPAVPQSPDEIVRDAAACVAAGATELHLHPRDGEGRESLAPVVIDAVAARVRAACGAPVGVSTGAWIEPDLERRITLVRGCIQSAGSLVGSVTDRADDDLTRPIDVAWDARDGAA